jgi:methyltransferase (TIGR00027 family)
VTGPRPGTAPGPARAERAQSGTVPTGVGRTALGVAMVRAMESRRRNRLFHDPYAAAFLAAAPEVFDPAQRGTAALAGGVSSTGAAFWSRVVIRTRFFDDFLLEATGRGIEQVVILAAGLDARAYRLAWPAGRRVFELDLPEVLAFKRRVLDRHHAVARCDHRPVAADLRADWAAPLIAAGLRPDRSTAWLLEGLLIYLSRAEADHLLTMLDGLSAPGSRVAFEFEEIDAGTLKEQARRLPVVAEYAALWQGGEPEAPGWLARHGWRVERQDGRDVCARYGRAARASPGGFITAIRS